MTTVQEHNATTGEVTIREMTDTEIEQFEADKAAIEAKRKAAVAAESAKKEAEAKLTALGLTLDDLKALGLS